MKYIQSQAATTAVLGKAKLTILRTASLHTAVLRLLNFKTTWSEFKKRSQTAAMWGKAKLRIKTHGQISKTRLLPSEAKLNYVYTTLKKRHLPRVGPKQLCALAHLGCTRAAGTS